MMVLTLQLGMTNGLQMANYATHFHGEPVNQVPKKFISSGKIFGRIPTIPQVNRESLT